ncbi:MAG: hypothetical protein NWE76_01945 [Candidatus Bathyarchaeota archaeon]|nr:hypothetical protein [Candidatus Bathyarchaeota archaeon]
MDEETEFSPEELKELYRQRAAEAAEIAWIDYSALLEYFDEDLSFQLLLAWHGKNIAQ